MILFAILRTIGIWSDRAACRGMDRQTFFVDVKTRFPSEYVQQICGGCEVRAECLRHAIELPEEYGVWGGTTPYQRKQLKRTRVRTYCPGCGSTEIRKGPTEVCLACGLSWPAYRQLAIAS